MRELQALLAVAEERSFTAAGRRLHLRQQTVSAIVRRLEVKLGVTLFERTTRRVDPTPACEALVPELAAALGVIDRALARVHDGAGLERPLRLAFTPSTGLGALQDLLHALATVALPEPEVRELWADEVPEALRSGRFDAAIGVELPPVPGWTVHPWRHQRVDLVVAASHAFASRGSVTVAELDRMTIVLPDHRTNPGLHEKLWATFVRAGVQPTIVPSARLSRTAPPSVEQGTAVSIWLTGMDDRHVPDGLTHVELHEPDTIVATGLALPSATGLDSLSGLEVLRDAIERVSIV